MNAQTSKPPSIDLVARFEFELRKCDTLRGWYDVSAVADRAGHAKMLGCTAFWACIALEELVASGAGPVGTPELREIISLRDTLDHPLPDSDVALRAHDRLKVFATAA